MNRRTLYVVGGIVVALLVAIVVLLVVLIAQGNAASDQAEHDRIVAICNETVDDPHGSGLDAWVACIGDLTD